MFTHADLVHFNGTENYYHHPFRLLKLTDGTHFLEQNGAGWLVDAIVSWQIRARIIEEVKRVNFQVWELTVDENQSGILTMRTDRGRPVLITQRFHWTDFPYPGIKLWVRDEVLMLPSEY